MIYQAIKEKFVVHTVERRWRQLRCTPLFRRWRETAKRLTELLRMRARRVEAAAATAFEAEQAAAAAALPVAVASEMAVPRNRRKAAAAMELHADMAAHLASS